MEQRVQTVYQFGPFRLETSEYRLLRDGEAVSLPHKAFEVLLALVESRGRVVLKEDLLKRVWPETFVEEANLAVAVSQLRKVLGDVQNGDHHYIETVRSIGYRFLALVRVIESPEINAQTAPIPDISVAVSPENLSRKAGAGMRLWRAPLISGTVVATLALLFGFNVGSWRDRLLSRGRAPHIESIAVLPLENLSRDPSEEYFADGMTEALITDLGKIGALRVISRTSVLRYKGTNKPVPEIARELHVDAIVEGSVQRFGDRVRITANLLHATTDRHLWAESYERDVRDMLALQTDVARAIAQEIRVKLTAQEQGRLARSHRVPPEAYEAYLQGRFYWNQRTCSKLKKALQYFESARDIDADWGLAYVGIADSNIMIPLYCQTPPGPLIARAHAAAVKALEIDNGLAEAHASRGLLYRSEWDWGAAAREFRQAIELNPSYASARQWYALYLSSLVRHDEALAEINRAIELDPLAPILGGAKALILFNAHRYPETIEWCRKAIDFDPAWPWFHFWLGAAYVETGTFGKGLTEFDTAHKLGQQERTLIYAGLAYAYARTGKRDEALKVLSEVKELLKKKNYVSSFDIGLVYIGLGEKKKALTSLENAADERSSDYLYWLNSLPWFASLHSDPHFQALLRRVGLPQ